MRYRRLGVNLLIALDVLLAEQSVTRPASRLNVTQPAMSEKSQRHFSMTASDYVIRVFLQEVLAHVHRPPGRAARSSATQSGSTRSKSALLVLDL